MYFFKNIFCLLSLVGAGIVTAQGPKDTTRIVTVLDKALETELVRINGKISRDTELVKMKHIIQQELPVVKAKIAYVVKHDLTREERSALVCLLQDLKNLSVTTTADLMLMAQGCSTYKDREAMNKAAEKYYPELTQKKASCSTYEERIALMKEVENIDLRNPSFNALNKFLCQCGYVEGLNPRNPSNCNDTSIPLLQQGINHVCKAIAAPFVVFVDFYFGYGWQQEFKRTGDIFAIVNMVCGQLLEEIDQK